MLNSFHFSTIKDKQVTRKLSGIIRIFKITVVTSHNDMF